MDNVLIVVDDLEAVKAFFIELGLKLEGETTVEGSLVGSRAHGAELIGEMKYEDTSTSDGISTQRTAPHNVPLHLAPGLALFGRSSAAGERPRRASS
jgi:hypothetical protein